MIFDKAFEHLIINEGGYSNYPSDIGGKTIYGITKKNYPHAFNVVFALYRDGLEKLALETAKNFYRKEFWNELYDEILDTSLAFKIFDLSVNMGKQKTIKLLQETINELLQTKRLEVDGFFGRLTLYYVNRIEKESLYNAFIKKVEKRYMKLGSFSIFGRGWLKRLNKRVYL